MNQGVIFDLYGTLLRLRLDSKPYLPFAKAICPEDPTSVLRRSIIADAPSLAALASRMDAPLPDKLPEFERDLRRDVEAIDIYDDVIETLAELRASGRKLGLISNLASPYKVPFYRLGLDPFSDVAVFSCDVGPRKPNPAIYVKAASDLGIEPGHLLMVGDKRRNDFDAPKAVGMGAILLERAGKRQGSTSIASLRELPELLPTRSM